jgi:hypothetical protein
MSPSYAYRVADDNVTPCRACRVRYGQNDDQEANPKSRALAPLRLYPHRSRYLRPLGAITQDRAVPACIHTRGALFTPPPISGSPRYS